MVEPKKKSWLDKLRTKYRFVVLNDSSLEEKVSLKLRPLSIFILTTAVIIFLIVLVTSIIAFTPLREYIPGYSSDIRIKRELLKVTLKLDSLETDISNKNIYIDNIKAILSGNISADSIHSKPDSTRKVKAQTVKASEQDSILRKEIESMERYTLATNYERESKNDISNYFFFAPIKGLVTTSFNLKDQHFGIDIVAAENEAIKATLDGTVVFTGWSVETGYIIQIQHSNNLISIYKHNSAVLKKMGQFVKAGEPIAIIGNSGETSQGPHLHFELWYNGNPTNPQEYIVF